MDFNQYYLDQAAGNYPVFKGSRFQRGYGLGNAFRRFLSWALPLLRQHALPLAKNIGKEVISNAASIATDAIDGKDVKEAAKEKFKSSIEKLSSGINQQTGNGYKRKLQFVENNDLKTKTKKRKKDYLD